MSDTVTINVGDRRTLLWAIGEAHSDRLAATTRERDLLLQAWRRGVSDREISEALGCSRDVAAVRRRRALQRAAVGV